MISIQKIATCTGHPAALYALAPGRDARHFCTAGGDGFITEWNLDAPETGRVIAQIETRIFSLCTLDDPNRLVAGNMTGGVHWLDRRDPARTRNIAHHQNKGVFAIAAPAPDRVLTAGGDGVLTRWDADAGRALESIKLSNQSLRSLAVQKPRGLVFVGASDRAIHVLDLEKLEVQKILPEAHGHSVFALACSPDGRHLLSGGRDAMLRVWDLDDDFRLISEQAAHLFAINDLVFSPDGRFFATASRDKTLKIWDAATFQLLKVADVQRQGGHVNSVNRLLWLPGGLVSCSDDRSAIIWEITG